MDLVQVCNFTKLNVLFLIIVINQNLFIGAECAPSIFGVDEGRTLPQLSEFLMSELKRHTNCVLWYNQKQKVQIDIDKIVNNVAAENLIYVSLI